MREPADYQRRATGIFGALIGVHIAVLAQIPAVVLMLISASPGNVLTRGSVSLITLVLGGTILLFMDLRTFRTRARLRDLGYRWVNWGDALYAQRYLYRHLRVIPRHEDAILLPGFEDESLGHLIDLVHRCAAQGATS